MPPSLNTVLPSSIGDDMNSTGSLPALGVAVGTVSHLELIDRHTLDVVTSVPWLTTGF